MSFKEWLTENSSLVVSLVSNLVMFIICYLKTNVKKFYTHFETLLNELFAQLDKDKNGKIDVLERFQERFEKNKKGVGKK